ncbi:MAG: TOBE domain-containing protein, partial [Defluviitaleaceae bacterium]|nr:TOBE domain-containing protein [Defluviitaleaceae bacterium]
LLDRRPKALSGGQRQRVAMGRAIVREPQVFLMDEPLSNLDAKLRVQMRTEITKLHQRLQTTFIYVTHDQTEAMTLGTRIVVMKDGVIQQVDSPVNLYNKPNNMFVAGFIGSPQMNMMEAVVKKNGDDLVVGVGEYDILLTEAKAKAAEAYVGKSVIMGIRPEDLHDEEAVIAAAAPGSVLEADVEVTELLGAEVFLYLTIAGQPVTARVNPRSTAKSNDRIKLAVDLNKVHLFDKETELVITN